MFAFHRHKLGFRLAALAFATGAVAITGVIQASAQDLPAFTCTDKSGGAASAAGTVYDVRVAHHDGYDRLVFGFPTASAMPQYQLNRQATAQFVRDASGQPVVLNGSAGIRLVLRNADIVSGAPSDLKPNLPEIREVTQIGNFERVVSYGVGLATPACFRVLELSGPTRLVIDVQTPPDASAATAAPSSSSLSASASPSTVATQPAAPSDLAATGHPAQTGQPANFLVVGLILGLLVVAGLTIAGIRRFARK
jgi:hypothetical protein